MRIVVIMIMVTVDDGYSDASKEDSGVDGCGEDDGSGNGGGGDC